MHTAFVGLGANLGDREGSLRSALRDLQRLPGVSEARLSPLYETEPEGPPQPAYLNACARLCLDGPSPRGILEALMGIEARHGRVRGEHWGPRTLDLDLLLFDDLVLEQPGLVLPHPRMQERVFVLKPLADLNPDLRHPVSGRTISELLRALEASCRS